MNTWNLSWVGYGPIFNQYKENCFGGFPHNIIAHLIKTALIESVPERILVSIQIT